MKQIVENARVKKLTNTLPSAPAKTTCQVEDELGLHFDDTALKAALDGLSEPYRQALELKFVQEYDYSEVAAVSGVSEENARAAFRARLAMRSALKGVASIPVVLIALLKRGEKAAAAATSATGAVAVSGGSTAATTAIPALAEAGVAAAHVAPAAVPLVAKAAVGIGLAAAVLTPTTDSAVHQAVDQLTTSSAGVITEEDPDPSPALGEAIAIASSLASDSETFNEADAFVLMGEELEVAELGAGRYSLSGGLSLFARELELETEIDEISWIRVDPELLPDNRYRVDGLLEFTSSTGSYGSIRLAGFAADTSNGLKMSGVYRYTGDLTEMVSEGSFEGLAVLRSLPAELVLQFAS